MTLPLISSFIQEVFKYLKEKLMKHICKSLKNIQNPPVHKISSIFSYITTFINREFYRLLRN